MHDTSDLEDLAVCGLIDSAGAEQALGLTRRGLSVARDRQEPWVVPPAGVLNRGYVWTIEDVAQMRARRERARSEARRDVALSRRARTSDGDPGAPRT